MLCVKKGDLEGLFDLFSRGLASHQDCGIYGETLFHVCPITVFSGLKLSVDQIKVACEFSQTHIVQRLIELNLDRMRDDDMGLDVVVVVATTRMSMGGVQTLASRGFFDPLSDAARDFEIFTDCFPSSAAAIYSVLCLSLAAVRQDVFEIYVRTCFPFWHILRPRRKQGILDIDSNATSWTVDAIRLLICPRGSIQAIDTRAWIDDQASLLHLVLSLYFDSCRGDTTRDWHVLLQEVITATDDLHYMLEPVDTYAKSSQTCSALKSALVLTLNNILSYGRGSPGDTETQRALDQLTANLQSLMSIIASCGHDLLEFGRREAAIWVEQDDTCRIEKEALIFEPRSAFEKTHRLWWCCRVIHYGPEPSDWYFEREIPQEDFAGEFWALVERPPLTPMPGAWVDEDWDLGPEILMTGAYPYILAMAQFG